MVLDTNCFQELLDRDRLRLVLGDLYAADLFIWPSAINVIEIMRHPSPEKRARLLELINELWDGMPVLPFPHALLKRVADGLPDGVLLEESGFESVVGSRRDVEAKELAVYDESLRALDKSFEHAFAAGRPEIQCFIRSHDAGDAWATTRAFLDAQWMTESQLAEILESESRRLGLKETLTFDRVLKMPTWRLFLEAFGAAMFRRVVLADPGRIVQATDLYQMAYLGGRTRSVLVSADGAFIELAHAVLDGRHALKRGVLWRDFV